MPFKASERRFALGVLLAVSIGAVSIGAALGLLGDGRGDASVGRPRLERRAPADGAHRSAPAPRAVERVAPAPARSGIAGRVSPATGETVVCARSERPAARRQSEPACEWTDDEGRFRLTLDAGVFSVVASSARMTSASQTVVVPASGAFRRVDVQLEDSHASIQGILVNRSGEPIARAWVDALHTESARLSTAISDEQGRFEVASAPGSTLVTVQAPGYGTESLAAQSPARLGRVTLANGASIAGRVVMADSERPVPGADVQATRYGQLDGHALMATTDGDGRFSFDDLVADRYALTADGADGVSAEATPVLVVEGEPVLDVVVRVNDGAAVSGVVRIVGDGAPCPDASVTLLGERRFNARPEGGSLVFGRVPLGSYQAWVYCPGYRAVEAPARVAVDGRHGALEWWVEAGLEIRGAVTDSSGRAVAGSSVSVEKLGAETITLTTDGTGRYRTRELTSGRYRVTPHSAGSNIPASEAREVELSSQEPSQTLDFVVAAGASVAVNCRSEQPDIMADLSVFGEAIGSAQGLQGQPAGAGRFVFSDVPDGSYRFFVADRTSSPLLLRGPSGQEEVDVQAGHDTVLSCVVPAGRRRLEGRVSDDLGRPVVDAWLSLRPLSGQAGRHAPLPSARVGTSDDGSFAFDGLRDERYRLRVEQAGRFLEQEVSVSDPADIVLPRAAQLLLELSFAEAASGELRAAVTNVRTGEHREQRAMAEPSRVTIDGLTPGEVQIEVSAGPLAARSTLDLAPGDRRDLALQLSRAH